MKKLILYLLPLAMVSVLLFGCEEDEEAKPEPLARFTAVADEDNPFLFTFTNDSENADTYSWDFGDGNTSTEMSPSHTYAEKGDYSVTLTATGEGGEATSTKDITVTGATPLMLLTGGAPGSGTNKVWRLEYSDPVNMYNKDNVGEWWFGWAGATTPGQRNAYRDDEYIFSADGTFEYKTNGDSFRPDQFYGPVPDGGFEDSYSWTTVETSVHAGGVDGSAWGPGVHEFRVDKTTEIWPAYCEVGTIVLKGKGAHIGPMDAGSLVVAHEPYDSTWYEIARLVDGEDQPDTLEVWTGWGGNDLELGSTRPAVGKIVLVSVKDPSQYPDPEDETTEEKPLEANDIYDTFDADGTMTWLFEDETQGDVWNENFDNPDASGLNTSAKVAKIYRPSTSHGYTNANFVLDYRMDLSTRNVFKMLVYFPSGETGDKKVSLKLQNSLKGADAWKTQAEIIKTFDTEDTWIEVTFDFTVEADITHGQDYDASTLTIEKTYYDKIVVQLGGETDWSTGSPVLPPAGTFYFDDIELQ
jgi:PKD repeat protein